MRGVIEMIDIRMECDECKEVISDGDVVYCGKCGYKKSLKIKDLEKKVIELKKELINVWIQKEQVDKSNESNKNIVGGGEE